MQSGQIESISCHGKPINIIIQVYAQTMDAEAEETEHFYTIVQEEIHHTPKKRYAEIHC